ncbi:hypothetical protein JTE90_024840 [Oedothorax gibbosus]|uniref:Kinetochore protein NDC80 n=1 Tax=Oedothorax gibbosus TaxID=931172 RepID=A0AAV6U4H8_9ARAC|nr:hypothetical protein JTE90_024840 [Oedothorax gibbosus]
MNFRASLCRSESKARIPLSTNPGRCSLQNENLGLKRPRSSSLEFRARASGSASKSGRSSSEERKSLLFPGRNTNRRSSINLDGGKAFKDTRPLNDKNYQKKKLTELIEFLTENNYQNPPNPQRLLQPSKKDFENIFQFLVSFFEPTFEVKKLEEDGPRLLKYLCYPFIPSKSAFTYVARTNIKDLLGVLFYLMDLAKFEVNFDEDSFFHNPEAERHDEQAILSEYIFTSYFHEREKDEEEEKEIFAKLIKSRYPYNYDELQEKKEVLAQELEHLQSEVDHYNELKVKSQKLDVENQEFEKFFNDMKQHKKKKEDICQKLADEVAMKESELQKLQDVLSQKQSLYDAQGFDGKRELSYFEAKKKELVETLEAKRVEYRRALDVQGEAEIQHRQAIDKNTAICETFNNLYSSTTDAAQNLLNPLLKLKDSQVKAFCASMRLEFPDCRLHPSQKTEDVKKLRASLEGVKRQVDSSALIFKGLLATQNHKMHELKMKQSELAINLKMVASEESQKERDLASKEKQALEEIKSDESEINEMIQKLEVLQSERIKNEEEYAAMKEELCKAEEREKESKIKLHEYLIYQDKLFKKFAKDIEDLKHQCQKSGERIADALEEAENER